MSSHGPTRSFRLPPRVRPGQAVKADDHNALIDALDGLIRELRACALQPSPQIGVKRGPGGTTAWLKRRTGRGKDRTPAFWPTLRRVPGEGEEDPATYEVTVTHGWVVERILPDGDALVWKQADNHFEDEEPQTLRKFPITVGQKIAVKIEVLPSGAIGIDSEEDPPPPPVTLAVVAGDQESIHYAPPIGDDEGRPGTYYVTIARLEGETPALVLEHAGQHIGHWVDLPTFEASGGEDIFRDFDPVAGKYRVKGLVGVSPILVTPTETTLEVGFDGGANLKLKIIGVTLGIDTGTDSITFGTPYIVGWHYWKDGIYVGQVDPFDEEEAVTVAEVHYLANAPAQA